MTTLIVKLNHDDYFFNFVNLKNFKVIEIFNESKIFYFIKRFCCKFKLPIPSFCYNINLKIIKKYDQIIILDSCLQNKQILKYLSKLSLRKKMVFYFMNSTSAKSAEKKIEQLKKKTNFLISSFDIIDCQKYKLLYNPLPYFKKDFPKTDIKFDICFVGKYKRRVIDEFDLYNIMNNLLLKMDFTIICDNAISKNLSISQENYIPYEEYLKKIVSSKAILDVETNQAGYSLRIQEAIYFNKKLITTNKNVLNEKFFNPNNILVLDGFNYKEIITFLNKPFIDYSKDVVEYFSLEQWCQRFNWSDYEEKCI